MKVALYKGTHTGISGLYNVLTRYLDRGMYSHCELVLSDGISCSSSYLDGGVRFKQVDYSKVDNWDFLDIPDPTGELEFNAFLWFKLHEGCKYDLLGNLRFVSNAVKDDSSKWFCSEAVMASLGFTEAYRYGPNGCAAVLRDITNKYLTNNRT